MDYESFLELAIDLAYEIQHCGAETYRVEDTINHLLRAYDIQGEVFAIPNTLIVSIRTPDGQHYNRMRRCHGASTDMEALEKFTGLCRELCRLKPDFPTAYAMLEKTKREVRHYNLPVSVLGHALAAFGFTLFFGGGMGDMAAGAITGAVVGLFSALMKRLNVNVFFSTVASGFVLSFTVMTLCALGLGQRYDTTIIGSLMLLVPGLLFTNAVRDVIYGDSMSGVNRLVQVCIIAMALAVGTGAAAALCRELWEIGPSLPGLHYIFPVQAVSCILAAAGFVVVFNGHGKGTWLCLLGAVISWTGYTVADYFGAREVVCYLMGTVWAAVYSEILARIRRCPATPYLVFSLLPLIPGSAIYYTMVYATQADMSAFIEKFAQTGSIAGALAVGILLISTASRIWAQERFRRMLKLKEQAK